VTTYVFNPELEDNQQCDICGKPIPHNRRKDEAGYDAEQASISDYAASLGGAFG